MFNQNLRLWRLSLPPILHGNGKLNQLSRQLSIDYALIAAAGAATAALLKLDAFKHAHDNFISSSFQFYLNCSMSVNVSICTKVILHGLPLRDTQCTEKNVLVNMWATSVKHKSRNDHQTIPYTKLYWKFNFQYKGSNYSVCLAFTPISQNQSQQSLIFCSQNWFSRQFNSDIKSSFCHLYGCC